MLSPRTYLNFYIFQVTGLWKNRKRFTSYALTLQGVQNNSTNGISDIDCFFSLMYRKHTVVYSKPNRLYRQPPSATGTR
jgi:hypothetical protein